jgi:hypothetical protein
MFMGEGTLKVVLGLAVIVEEREIEKYKAE